MKRSVTRDIPQLELRADVVPSTLDAESRTVEVVWTTGARVKRGFWEPFYEELSLDPKHVRMGRLSSGNAPLLNSHRSSDLSDVIGVVESAKLEGKRGTAKVRFARSPEGEAAFQLVSDGIVRNVSIGYRVHKLVKVEDGEDKVPVYRAEDWEPFEISAVPIGADAGAVTRSGGGMTNPCVFLQERAMDPDNETPERNENRDAERERERVLGIQRIGRALHRPEREVMQAISEGTTLEDFRAAAIDALASAPPEHGGNVHFDRRDHRAYGAHGSPLDVGRDGSDFRAASVDAILLRAGVQLSKRHPAARDVSGSVLDIARTCISRAGHTVSGGSNDALIKRAMTTSDFPLILADSMHRAVRNGYEVEPSSHRAWVRPQPVVDFRDQNRPILGSAPALKRVLEGAEYTNGPLDEDSAKYQVAKYGRIVTLTWETLVNDDLGAFLRIQPAMGQAARRLEADTVYALLALNAGAGPTMQDTKALFHVDHGNLGTAGAFSADLLGAARALLRKQTALGGGYLSLVPRYMIVPVELEQKAETVVAAATRSITTVDASTPQWIARLEIVVEPRLAANAFYLAADTAQIDTCELGMLEENVDGPRITTEDEKGEGFRRDVFSWKVRHVIGAKFLDWRGIVKQPVS